MSGRDEPIECRSYTFARRHPQVIGRIGGWPLPWPLTPVQFAAGVGSFVVLLYTRPLWAHLGTFLELCVQVGLPVALAWSVRHARVEGRPPHKAALGALACAFAVKRANGRPHRERTEVLGGPGVFMRTVAVVPGGRLVEDLWVLEAAAIVLAVMSVVSLTSVVCGGLWARQAAAAGRFRRNRAAGQAEGG